MSKVKDYYLDPDALDELDNDVNDQENLPPDYQASLDSEQEMSEKDKKIIEECF